MASWDDAVIDVGSDSASNRRRRAHRGIRGVLPGVSRVETYHKR